MTTETTGEVKIVWPEDTVVQGEQLEEIFDSLAITGREIEELGSTGNVKLRESVELSEDAVLKAMGHFAKTVRSIH